MPPELKALPALLTVHEAAVALRMSDLTVRRRVADKTLKGYRVGPRSIRIDRESLIKLAQSQVIGA